MDSLLNSEIEREKEREIIRDYKSSQYEDNNNNNDKNDDNMNIIIIRMIIVPVYKEKNSVYQPYQLY